MEQDKFAHSFDFPSPFRYFARLFLVTTWEVVHIIFDARFDLADVEGIVDVRETTVCGQVEYVVIPLLADVLDAERSDLSRYEPSRCVPEVDVLHREKNLLAG